MGKRHQHRSPSARRIGRAPKARSVPNVASVARTTTDYEMDFDAIRKLVGSQITSFGINQKGEIFMTTSRGHEFVIGKDENADVALYEIERPSA